MERPVMKPRPLIGELTCPPDKEFVDIWFYQRFWIIPI